jgi:hypothetical protein
LVLTKITRSQSKMMKKRIATEITPPPITLRLRTLNGVFRERKDPCVPFAKRVGIVILLRARNVQVIPLVYVS